MTTATVGSDVVTPLLYAASLVVVVWCIVDVTRRPPEELSRGKKTAWVVASLLGWLLFGIVGAAIATFYLVGQRRRMNPEKR